MTTDTHILNPDAQAVFLLCGRFGKHDNSNVKPLTRNQYNEVASWLHRKELRPAVLLRDEGREQLREFGNEGKITQDRLTALLQRGTAMAMFAESWTNQGGWILARSDDAYPKRFKKHLGHLAPPILYGVGERRLLERGGVSMVGSRDADDDALSFVTDLATRCAEDGIQVISGGARGVDRTAMEAALDAGGAVVGAMANGLGRTARKKAYRTAIMDGRLTLISAYYPESRFAVWKAMGRNKHIYTLGDATVVAHSAVDSGGTWAGAIENLKHKWVPLFVLAESPTPEGNRKLIDMGGIPVTRKLLQSPVDLDEWLRDPASRNGDRAGDLFKTDAESESTPSVQEETETFEIDSSNFEAALSNLANSYIKQCRKDDVKPDLFFFVWPLIKSFLNEGRSEREIEEAFGDLRLTQARDWLMQAVEQGKAVRAERPVRYSLPEDEHKNEKGESVSEDNDDDARPQDLFSES